MDDNTKYFERAIEILFEKKERDYRKILYKVAAVSPRSLVEAVDGIEDNEVSFDFDSKERDDVMLRSYVGKDDAPPDAKVATPEVVDFIEDGNFQYATLEQQEIVDQLYDAGFTTSQIATAAGVSQTTVYKWKNKTKRPNAHRISLLRTLKDLHDIKMTMRKEAK